MEQTNTFQKIIVPIISLILILILFILYFGSMRNIKTDTIKHSIATKKYVDPFLDIKLSATAAFVWDVKEQKMLFGQKDDMVLPLASLTKVMMAVTAVELEPSYTSIAIQKEFLEEEGDSGLFVNEQWNLKDLVDFSLTTSSNDGSRAIASVIGSMHNGTKDIEMGRREFINLMNEKAQKIGLKKTYFTNEDGLDTNETLGGAYGTAHEMALLFEYALRNYPDLMDSTRYSRKEITSDSNIVHVAENTNNSVDKIPGIIASKTGYTSLAGGNLVITFDPQLGRPIIISVLGSTPEGRFADVETLINASRVYLDQQ